MDYSKMSDFEINKAVGESTGEALNTEETLNLVIRNSTGRRFDPCKSWADAGPIIQKHGITLAFFDDEWTADFDAYFVDGVEWNIGGVADKNPLRAAMIVYLMMHDKGEE